MFHGSWSPDSRRNLNWYSSLFALGGAVYAAYNVNGAPWGCVAAVTAVPGAEDTR